MNNLIFKTILVFLFLISVGISQDNSDEFEELSQKQTELDSLFKVRESAVEQVYLLEEQLSLTSKLLTKLERRQRRIEAEIGRLTTEIDSGQSTIDRLRNSLAENLRNFYINYHPQPHALILAGDIHTAARQAHYFKATVNSLKSHLDSIQNIQSTLETKQARLNRISSETAELVKRKNFEESLLSMKRSEKQKLLTRIERDVDLKKQYLEETSKSRSQLGNLHLGQDATTEQPHFTRLKGKLERPVAGKIVQHFGPRYDKQTKTETFFPGIAIKADIGTEVKAAASGKVVHADYLRGFGNMVIISHGEGWYTLYGHLSRIRVVRGDAVREGDVIGLSGQSGSEVGPALFFGVRNREESYDPVEWLK